MQTRRYTLTTTLCNPACFISLTRRLRWKVVRLSCFFLADQWPGKNIECLVFIDLKLVENWRNASGVEIFAFYCEWCHICIRRSLANLASRARITTTQLNILHAYTHVNNKYFKEKVAWKLSWNKVYNLFFCWRTVAICFATFSLKHLFSRA